MYTQVAKIIGKNQCTYHKDTRIVIMAFLNRLRNLIGGRRAGITDELVSKAFKVLPHSKKA